MKGVTSAISFKLYVGASTKQGTDHFRWPEPRRDV